jgi:hypothetical protein
MKSKNDSPGCLGPGISSPEAILEGEHALSCAGIPKEPRKIWKLGVIIPNLGVNLVSDLFETRFPEIKPESQGYIKISSRR